MNAVAQLQPVPTADELAQAWIACKQEEERANTRRIAVEQQLVTLLGQKEEGATTHDLPSGFKLTITGKLGYKVDDMNLLEQLAANLPPDLLIIKTEKKLDETGAKWLRANRPELWHQVARAITVKPAKTAVQVKI